jgi:endonuclease G, mitochondrial
LPLSGSDKEALMSESIEGILQDQALADNIKQRLRGTGKRTRALEAGTDLRSAAARDPGFEKVIELIGRPAYLVKNGSINVAIGDVWGLRLATRREALKRAIRATARVEVSDSGGSWYEGTAWLIAPGLAVTNRHVARAFARRKPDGTGELRKDFKKKSMSVMLDFVQEFETDDRFQVGIEEIPFIAEDDDSIPDIALLKLAPSARPLPDPIPLADATPVADAKAWIVAIGYPALDPHEDASVRADVFKDIFDVKRVAPGVIRGLPSNEWYLVHDCSTLGGNSGSVILDMKTGAATGLHFKGTARVANYAVRIEALRKIVAPFLEELKVQPGSAVSLEPTPPPLLFEAPLDADDERVSKRSAEVLATRKGYVSSFLGSEHLAIPRPKCVRSRANDAVKLKGTTATELDYTHFSLEVSTARGLPLWTAVNVQPGDRAKVGRPGWINEPRLQREQQLGDDYYKEAQLSRGHMVRRLDPVWGDDWKEANDETHIYTNACPQVQSFNDGLWGDLEDYALYDRAAEGKISVFTGPILDDRGDPELFEVRIPIRFWKIIAFRKSNKLTAAAFVLSQEKDLESSRWTPYQWTIRALEAEIDIEFGPLRDVDPEAAVEGPTRKRPLYAPEDARF